ncbi:TPA: fimbrial protein [Providencia alcalifaciens]|uniref:fimbrial protein n=1 Tax=Providencia alcalifaciens TaxID=126385 RepID=UPI000447D2F4|nr:fimbrial protein [Providencia alcalifaciens]ETT05259.1 fimbrial protein [Providencia alcalifaciens F90-2004]EUC94817.1 fimbrial protein [Providencia alcalifaciens PAL-2]EUD02714.1 fimbrial protein [Providencia alcalifaciens RIMD 1656011]MTB33698.1 fimbrial protein [Providencia alcalifaciens]MTC32215.1 fimbrial protein [Providencia alcalifaciens]
MHIFNKILNILGINLAMLTVPTVLASGVINFTGEITEQACTVDSKSRNLNVDLGRVSTRSLSSQGEVAGVTNFIIKLVDCPDDTKVTVNFAGTRDSVDHHILALHQGNGMAKNVGVALYEKNAVTPIKLYENTKEVELDGDSVELEYVAAYKATGVATAGQANSSAVYSIKYQ